MKLKPYSFRYKIIIALVIVISSVSFIAFYLFSNALSKIIHKDDESGIISALDLLKEQFYFKIIEHDGRVIKVLLDNFLSHEKVLNTYLVNYEGNVVYPPDYTYLLIDSLTRGDSSVFMKEISIHSFKTRSNHISRAFISMKNIPECHECHSPDKKQLGFIVIDFSMDETERKIAFTQRFSIFFTISMVFVIFAIVLFMHYKFIRKSLIHFRDKINLINKGNLNERFNIPETKELGKLGKSFNHMIEKFQMTQKELQIYHKKELKNQEKLATIGEMAARLAHEIRNPITGIANAIEIIADEEKDNENMPILEEIKRQATRVNNAITDLLRFSRAKKPNFQKQDINEIINSVVFFLKSQPQHQEINFILKLNAGLPKFMFDYEQIESVLMNLTTNALQAIEGKGSITYKSSYNAPDREALISVEDTGSGIPDDIATKIFKPFYTTRTEGTGLGLPIIKDIIEKHKGEIWLEKSTGNGSVFCISLPI